MNTSSYKGQFLFLYLIDNKKSFKMTNKKEFILEDYKVIFTSDKNFKKNNINIEEFKDYLDYKIIFCKCGIIESKIVEQELCEFKSDFDYFVLF